MNRFVIDTSAWIDYLSGSPKGKKVELLLSSEQAEILITGLIVAEVATLYLKQGTSSSGPIEVLKSLARLMPFGIEAGKRTAEIYVHFRKSKPKFGIADAHIVALAEMHNAKLITCDFEFSGLPNVKIIQ